MVSRQKVNPRSRNRLVIETAQVVVSGKRLNSAAHPRECGLERITLKMQPRQSQVIGMAKLGSEETAGVERLQKFVIAQVGRGKNKGHKADYRIW